MFELIKSVHIDVEKGRATAEAFVGADHPLFADHFPGSPLLAGSLALELAAQVSGPLAEEVTEFRLGIERWAFLGMVRDARFLRPVFLPSTINLAAEVTRSQPSTINTTVTAEVSGQRVMRAELVMMMIEASSEWAPAIDARHSLLARWKGTS